MTLRYEFDEEYEDIIVCEKPLEKEQRTDNICEKCNIATKVVDIGYICEQCGTTYESQLSEMGGAVDRQIKITTGKNAGKFYYSTNNDYTQQKATIETLLNNARNYNGVPFSVDILHNVADKYNEIRSIREEKFDKMGESQGIKKTVNRSSIKDEILAALLYFQCLNSKTYRKKTDCAAFMKLPKDGFATGENRVRTWVANGKLEMQMPPEPPECIIDRYLEALNIEQDNYRNFVLDVINIAKQHKIGMGSQLSSRIVGAIWVIIVNCKLDITAKNLEEATDKTKKNTFVKFSNVLHREEFLCAFIKNGIDF